jgi:hypothetical protein
MGNDGGSIPTRRELVKEAARNPTTSELKESQQEAQAYYWTYDPVSRKPLAQPVVSDAAGKLYNKDTILEFLLEGSRKEDVEKESHGLVKGLKDVVEVKFEVDAEAAGKVEGEVVWKCPVTGSRLGPGSKAVYLVPCGHVFSGSAIKEISGEKCLTCDTEYASNDVIPILPTAETDIARLLLRTKTLAEKGLTHSLKKGSSKGESKKRKKTHDTAAVASSSKDKPSTTVKSPELADEGRNNRINNSATASLTAKVLHEQETAKKRKLENKNVQSLFSNRDGEKHHGKSSDFMTRGFSVPAGTKK